MDVRQGSRNVVSRNTVPMSAPLVLKLAAQEAPELAAELTN
jgi:hypothetical protein